MGISKDLRNGFKRLGGNHGFAPKPVVVLHADTPEDIAALVKEAQSTLDEAVRLANISGERLAKINEGEAKRTLDESKRELAENTRKAAENQRIANEQERQTNEQTRGTNETARQTAENQRKAAEDARALAESARVLAEQARDTAESARVLAESGRVSAEAARVLAEQARVVAEQARDTAESARSLAETARAAAETIRQSNEATRQSNEATRQANETARQSAHAAQMESQATAYTNAEANRDGAYTNAEEDRDEAFEAKEATRDAANQAALNCAETLSALGPKIDQMEPRVNPTIYKANADPNYEQYIQEAYAVDMPNGDIVLKYFSTDNSVYFYPKSSGVFARASLNGKGNGDVVEVKVSSSTNLSTYPIGKTVGYVIFKDIDGFKANSSGQENSIVNRVVVTNASYSPSIKLYLNTASLTAAIDALEATTEQLSIDVENTHDAILPSSFIDPSSVFLSSDGITSKSMMESFIKSFEMLIERDEDYDYGILKVNNGLPAGSNYAWAIVMYKWPAGETPTSSNVTNIGQMLSATKPANGVTQIGSVAKLNLNWDALTSAFGGSSYFNGVGTGVRYNQEVIFGQASGSLTDRVNSLEEDVEELKSASGQSIAICVPSQINAVVGDTLQLYYDAIFRCVNVSIYDINVICDIGSQYPRYFEVTPIAGQIGNHTITFKIRDNNKNIIAEKSSTLVVYSAGSSPSSALNVLCVGASATLPGTWASELKRRLTQSGGTPVGSNFSNINFVGRMPVTKNGITVNLEATGGYTFTSYTSTTTMRYRFNVTAANEPNIGVGDVYSNNGYQYTIVEINITAGQGGYFSCEGNGNPQTSGTLTKVSGTGDSTITFSSTSRSGNPFAYNGAINIQQYAEDYCNGQIDVVYTELFGNGTSAYADDLSTRLSQMRTFINNILAVFPNCKFCIGLFWNPDVRGGMGVNYRPNDNWSLGYGIKYTNMNLCNALQKYITDENLGDKVFICNWLNEFDTLDDMQQTTKKVNPRSSVTEIFGVNGVHPSDVGYNQMADTAWRLFVAKFCR